MNDFEPASFQSRLRAEFQSGKCKVGERKVNVAGSLDGVGISGKRTGSGHGINRVRWSVHPHGLLVATDLLVATERANVHFCFV